MSTQKIEPRSKALSLMLLVPVVFASFLGLSIFVLLYLMWKGEDATGERVEMIFAGECMGEAVANIKERASGIGLGSAEWVQEEERLTLWATLPDLPEAKESISRLLTRPGRLEMRHKESVIMTNEDIVEAKLALDEGGMAETQLMLDGNSKVRLQKYMEQYRNDLSEIWFDDDFVINRPNTIEITDEFRLVSEATNPRVKMQQSVDFIIVLSAGVLPCEITLESIQVVQ